MNFQVADIEQLLYKAFPATDALSDDRHGLSVGNPEAEVTKIAIALDATISLIKQAAAQGCNVLVTHHPVFWYAPDCFLAATSPGLSSGAAVFAAAEAGVALISMHTNVDCSPQTAEMLLEPIGFCYHGPLQPAADSDQQSVAVPVVSLGQRGIPSNGVALTLQELAERYTKAFGQLARVWGERDRFIKEIAVCSGSGSDLVTDVLKSDADCYVTGELRYHEALALTEAGVALIELGHDISELPYRHYLRAALEAAGFPPERLLILGPSATWWH